MIKVIPPSAWGDLLPPPELVKFASTGLTGFDLTHLIKRASHPLASWVRDHPPKPGEVYVHAVAMGSTERYGSNRNHDGWTAAMLERDHPTFEKHARWYLNHSNSDPARSYGVIRRAYYNPEIQRVDVIAALNGTKEAAERNGGLVAERTLSKLTADHDIAVSMSARVPYDACNLCGHKAKHRGEYCLPDTQGGTCKYAGCRNALGRVYDDGAHQFVDNPYGMFFDLSDVSDTRGADRTAFVTGKVAGHYTPGGAELAEQLGLVPPEHLLEPRSLAQLRCLRKLAATKPRLGADWAISLAVREKLARGDVRHYRQPDSDHERHRLLGELAQDGVVLPPAEWLSVVTGVPVAKCAGFSHVNIDTDILRRSDLHDILGGTFADDIRVSPVGTYAWMSPTKAALAREAAALEIQAEVGVVKVANTPMTEPVSREIAAYYAAYLGSAMAVNENSQNFPLMLTECARHTRHTA